MSWVSWPHLSHKISPVRGQADRQAETSKVYLVQDQELRTELKSRIYIKMYWRRHRLVKKTISNQTNIRIKSIQCKNVPLLFISTNKNVFWSMWLMFDYIMRFKKMNVSSTMKPKYLRSFLTFCVYTLFQFSLL